MRSVGIKELKDQASRIVAEEQPVVVEKHGKPVGMYLPIRSKGDKLRAYQAAQTIDRILQEVAVKAGVTIDEYLDELEAAVADEKAQEQGKLL